MEQNSRWKTSELSSAYLEGVRGAIPGADLQLSVIAKIVDMWCAAPRRILDLGCGNGILGRYLMDRFPDALGLFLDFSKPMLAAARLNTASLDKAEVKQADFGSPAWTEAAQPYGDFDIVVSGFAIHHQPDERKKVLYAEIFDLLAPGGGVSES